MADHFARSVELLHVAAALEAELDALQSRPTWPAATASALSRRHGAALKRAEIHATLSVAQALQDAAAMRESIL